MTRSAKPPSQQGLLTNVTRYSSPEGERLADLMARLNERHGLGLRQSKHLSDSPGMTTLFHQRPGFLVGSQHRLHALRRSQLPSGRRHSRHG
jgi:hypothetical protein